MISGASTARNTRISITRITRLDSSSVRRCALGALEGRNELLSVLTTLESGEKRPIVKTAAAIQNAITK